MGLCWKIIKKQFSQLIVIRSHQKNTIYNHQTPIGLFLSRERFVVATAFGRANTGWSRQRRFQRATPASTSTLTTAATTKAASVSTTRSESSISSTTTDVVVTFSAILLFRSSWILGKSQHRINFRDSVNVLWTY